MTTVEEPMDESNPGMSDSSRRRRTPRRTKSAFTGLPKTFDEEEKALSDMDKLTRDLERMARVLGRVDDPQKILLKHMKQNSSRNCAA